MAPEDSIVKGLKVVAANMGVSVRTTQRWAKDPSFPRLSGRRFDLLQIRAWLDQRDGRPAVSSPAKSGDPRQPELAESRGKNYQDERLKRAKADKVEMENRKSRRELVKLAEVEQLFAARAAIYKQSVLGLESFILALLPDEERRVRAGEVRRRLWEAVENITRPLPETFLAPTSEVAQGGA